MEVLSEHLLSRGGSRDTVLTGRHGMWSSYEAFAQVVDSMLTQHAKWLEQCGDYPWRRPLASLNVLLTSHVWRQDHNGFSHQATGLRRQRAGSPEVERSELTILRTATAS